MSDPTWLIEANLERMWNSFVEAINTRDFNEDSPAWENLATTSSTKMTLQVQNSPAFARKTTALPNTSRPSRSSQQHAQNIGSMSRILACL